MFPVVTKAKIKSALILKLATLMYPCMSDETPRHHAHRRSAHCAHYACVEYAHKKSIYNKLTLT